MMKLKFHAKPGTNINELSLPICEDAGCELTAISLPRYSKHSYFEANHPTGGLPMEALFKKYPIDRIEIV